MLTTRYVPPAAGSAVNIPLWKHPKTITLLMQGRIFLIYPETSGPVTKETAWSFVEEIADGSIVASTDIMGCSGPLGFVEMHLRKSLGLP